MGCRCSKCPEDPKTEFFNNTSNLNIISEEKRILGKNETIEEKNKIDDINLEDKKINKNDIEEKITNLKERHCLEYPKKILELINKVRENPPLYADEIENSIENIKHEESSNKIIYQKNIKILLHKGEDAFREAAEILKKEANMPPLELKDDICIPFPKFQEDFNNPNYLKDQVELIKKKNKINAYYIDRIIDPDICVLLMIVDDTIKSPGRKREVLLNKEFKYIGISCGIINDNFISYFSFSK